MSTSQQTEQELWKAAAELEVEIRQTVNSYARFILGYLRAAILAEIGRRKGLLK